MSKLISLAERIAVPAGAEPPVERVVAAHLARGFRKDGDALVRGTRIASYLSGAPSEWRTTAVVAVENGVLTVTWTIDVSGQKILQGEMDVLLRELSWIVSERAADALPPPDFTYDIGDSLLAAARRSPAGAALAVLTVLIPAGVALTSLAREEIPDLRSLQPSAGQVDWVDDRGSLLRFALRGEPRVYGYNGKGGRLGQVVRELKAAQGSTVSLRYAAPLIEPGVGPAYYRVWDISIEDRPVRSYEDTRRAWHADNLLGVCIGAAAWFALLVPMWLGGRAYRRQRRRISEGGPVRSL